MLTSSQPVLARADGASVLVAGAGFAGLATAYWMNRLGFKVTLVEVGSALKRGGTPVDIREGTVDVVRRMGLLEQIKANKLRTRPTAFKTFEGATSASQPALTAEQQEATGSYEIDRDVLLNLMFESIKNDVELLFGDSINSLTETDEHVAVNFASGLRRHFSLVFGCDGNHSALRRMHFGPESDFAFFLHNYFALAVVKETLIEKNTSEIYNAPGLAMMINAYDSKSDIGFTFFSQNEIPYNYRDQAEQRSILTERFAVDTPLVRDMLNRVTGAPDFYFDKFCQIRMPSWTKGRVALVGDAGYCASPAAGMGGSLAIVGATALADGFAKHPDDFTKAFAEYEANLRPFVEHVQAEAINSGLEMFAPRTEEAIEQRNAAFSHQD